MTPRKRVPTLLPCVLAALLASCEVEFSGVLSPAPDDYEPWPDLVGSWTVSLSGGQLRMDGPDAGACELEGVTLRLQHPTVSRQSGPREAPVTGEYSGGTLVCRGVTDRLPLPAPFGGDTLLVITTGFLDGWIRDDCADPVGMLGGCKVPYVPEVELRLVDVAPASPENQRFHLMLNGPRPTSERMEGRGSLVEVRPTEGGGSMETWVLSGDWEARR
jgi:hypothetical protein